ncbi:MAG: signal peptidase I [Candidatus Azotimanducaceae bacterium]|jgi:signal peptidase I
MIYVFIFVSVIILVAPIYLFKVIAAKLLARAISFGNAFKTLLLYSVSVGIVSVLLTMSLSKLVPDVSDIVGLILAGALFVFWIHRLYSPVTLKQSIKLGVVYFFATLILTLVTVVPFRLFIAEPFIVSGLSMSPTYEQGAYIIINKLDRSFAVSDIVIFRFPDDESKFAIKRIVAVSGDRVRIADGGVYVNESLRDDTYVVGDTVGDTDVVLDDNEYYLLGDNREFSRDSRDFGPVSKELILGKPSLF